MSRQRPRNRDALLLASGKLGRLVIHAVEQADAFEHLLAAAWRLLALMP